MDRRRHPWVYDNEIASGPDAGFADGDLVMVEDFRGKPVGTGYFNRKSKIALRYLTRNPQEEVDESFWKARVRRAYNYRRDRYAGRGGLPSAFRLVHGEADGLPGLTVDVYDRFAVCQFLALGLERWRQPIIESIAETLSCQGIYERSDSTIRNLEGLEQKTGVLWGASPPDLLEFEDEGAVILADLKHGAKTGLFLDQLDNHKAVAKEASNRQVLNCFSYTGLFGLRAAMSGALAVTEAESSTAFNDLNQKQWSRNNLTVAHNLVSINVFDYLHQLHNEHYETDVIILDPPAFTKKRASRESAARGYNEINRLALRLIRPGGVLVTCSCSHHLSSEEFRSIVHMSAIDARRTVKMVAALGQPPDHPVLLDAPESDYLKCFILAVE